MKWVWRELSARLDCLLGLLWGTYWGLNCLIPWVVNLEIKMRCFSSWVYPGCLLQQPTVHFKREVRRNDRKALRGATGYEHIPIWWARSACWLPDKCVYCCVSLIWRCLFPSHFLHIWNSVCLTVNGRLIPWQIITDNRFLYTDSR